VDYGVACDFGGREDELDVRVKGMGRVEFEEVGGEEGVVSIKTAPNGVSRIAADYEMSVMPGTPWCAVSINSTMTCMIGNSLRSGTLELGSHQGTGMRSCEFSEKHFEILARFQSRTSLTVGGMCPLSFKPR
jgi:hypothetical protein